MGAEAGGIKHFQLGAQPPAPGFGVASVTSSHMKIEVKTNFTC